MPDRGVTPTFRDARVVLGATVQSMNRLRRLESHRYDEGEIEVGVGEAEMITNNGTLKQHQPTCPVEVARLTQRTKLDPTKADTQNPLLIERGVKLLNHLVALANQGESVGVGYAQFVCCIHGVKSFEEVFNQSYLPSDTKYVLRLAHRITAATGRKRVTKNGVTLEAGMDTFIWQSKPPYRRPSEAFESTPYTEEVWMKAFPDGDRRLLNQTEHSEILGLARDGLE